MLIIKIYGAREKQSTCQTFLLMFSLLLSVEVVEGPRRTVGEKWRELLRLKLLLDAVELTAASRHCRQK